MISGQNTQVPPTLSTMSSTAAGVAVREQHAPTHHGAEERRGRAKARAAHQPAAERAEPSPPCHPVGPLPVTEPTAAHLMRCG